MKTMHGPTWLWVALFLTMTVLPAAASRDAGTESALYLAADGRSMALGRATVTDYESSLASNWNPAGLAFLPQISLALQQASLFGGAVHQSAAAALPTLDWGTVALSGSRIQIGDIERRDAANLPAGSFSYLEQMLLLAYGVEVWNGLAVGVATKLQDLRLDDRQSSAPGLDAGILFRMPLAEPGSAAFVREVAAGLAVRNAVSPVLRLDQDPDRMFPSWNLGAAAIFKVIEGLPDRLMARVEADKPERADLRWHAGVEYAPYPVIAVRGGWDHEYFSAGAGLKVAGIQLDYGVSFPEIGMRHLVTLSAAFGRDMTVARSQRAADEERRRQEIVDNLKTGMVNDYRQQAKALMAKEDWQAAAKLWEKVLDWEPDNAEAKTGLETARREIMVRENEEALKLAREYFRNQKFIDVMVECRNVLDRDPKNAAALELNRQAENLANRMGNTALSMNLKTLENIRKEYQLGLKAYTERDWEKAITHWERVIETTPLQKQVYSYLQTARTRLVKTKEESVKIIQVKQAETQREKMYKAAGGLARSAKRKAAVRSFEKLATDNPQDKDAQKNLEKTRQDLIDSQKKGIRW